MAANISTVPRAAAVPAHAPVLDAARVRRDFPILDRLVNGQPLVYLDSAASAQEPRQVLRAVEDYATQSHANVHRGVHALSQAATAAFEGARERVRRFINARAAREIIFTRGTTEAINLVAQAWARERLGPGDEILITALEHHANIVPWQMVREQTGCELKVAPIDRRGELLWDEFLKLLGPRTRLVAVAHVSNALGTVLPVERIVDAAHAARRAGAHRRRAGRAAHPRRRAGDRLRLLRLLGPQALRAHRHRRAVRARGAARRDAALAGRRRHDPDACRSRRPRTTSCRTSSRPERPTSPAPWDWRPRWTTSRAWGCDAIAAHEQRLLAAATRAAHPPAVHPARRHGGRTRQPCCPSP